MKETKLLLRQHKLTYFLPLGLALGLLAQWLFVGHSVGISWLVFVLALLAALLFSGRRAGVRPARRNLWLWPALLFFAAMVFWRANPFLTFLNIMATLGLLAFVFHFYAAGSAVHLSLTGILVLPGRMLGHALGHFGPVVATGFEPINSGHVHRRELAPVLRGGALAVPVIIVFTMLLASADLVFNATLQRIVGLDFATITPYVGRGIFVTLVTMLAAGGAAAAVIRGLRQPQDDESWIEQMTRTLPLRFSLSAVETSTLILLVSGLFFAFVLLQFRYLFGGESNITQQGISYAEYARRGFFELVLVASLSLALILFLNWLTRRESKRQVKIFNLFSSVLIGLVLLILVTAFWRMRLYEQAYGYTELRLIVLVFELWLGLLLVWFLVTLWRAPEQFAPGFLVVVLCFMATLNLIDLDALIVRHNLEHYRSTGDLDMVYLSGLSADAVPELVDAWPEIEADDQLLVIPYCYDGHCQATMGELLNDNLRARYHNMLEDQEWLNGRSYHHARYQANQALACFYAPEATTIRLGVITASCQARDS